MKSEVLLHARRRPSGEPQIWCRLVLAACVTTALTLNGHGIGSTLQPLHITARARVGLTSSRPEREGGQNERHQTATKDRRPG
jgi:hypothetical protein